jgi:aminomuconate-semialdehyde/2-hydroxymuconate-6-semialdehyde dehydrogenase
MFYMEQALLLATPLVSHAGIKAISFTGGTQTGADHSSRIAAPKFKKLSLELGVVKMPHLVFSDCNFDETVSETARAAFSNQGQICLCGSRILIQRSIYDQVQTSFRS